MSRFSSAICVRHCSAEQQSIHPSDMLVSTKALSPSDTRNAVHDITASKAFRPYVVLELVRRGLAIDRRRSFAFSSTRQRTSMLSRSYVSLPDFSGLEAPERMNMLHTFSISMSLVAIDNWTSNSSEAVILFQYQSALVQQKNLGTHH